MKQINKKDILYLWIIVLSFLLFVFLLSNTMYLYGSQLDWNSQHFTIPEYFRTLFYSTKELFPDFAFNIGSGQNIYNLSYYGFLSPIVLFSYLFPFVSMQTYMIVSTIISVIISTILFYVFLKNKKFSSEVCFASSFLFIFSTSLSFHSHRHIMFITYMPFLILALFGVDKKVDSNKGWLLSLATFLMIMTNYYYSVGGIAVIIVYGIYRYLQNTNKVTLKQFIKNFINLIIPIIVAVLSSMIILLPTLYTLLNNRAKTNSSIELLELLIPHANVENVMYRAYGVGLTAIVIPAIISFFKMKKENIFLALILLCAIITNLPNYILNGTMYIDPKSLIPFLPLYVFVIAEFIKNIFDKKINYKVLIPCLIAYTIFVIIEDVKVDYFVVETIILLISIFAYNKMNKKVIIILPAIIIAFLSAYNISKTDNLVLKYQYKDETREIRKPIKNITSSDQDFYRIANDTSKSITTNNIYGNIDYYNSTIYSSVSNQEYNKFYYDVMNNNIPYRNRALTVTTNNIMFLMLSNNKYLISQGKPLHGYELLSSEKGIHVYKNENVLPLGFATSNVMSYEDFSNLSNPIKQEALLNLIVAETESNNKFVASTQNVELEYDKILKHKNIKKEKNGSYSINADDTIKISYELPKQFKNKIIFISFKMNKKSSCSKGDLAIKINNVKNTLTCSSWKYYNGNETFEFVLAEKDLKELNISFIRGNYNISNIKTYILDYASIENVNKKVDQFVVDKKNTKGDYIRGNIEVTKDGYFMLTVPYDTGYKIKVDNKTVKYEKVDEAFVGFKITEGKHQIEIEYQAPLKNISALISLFGIISFAAITYIESKRRI